MNSSVVPDFHLCNKSICEISSLLNIPRSTVSGIITKIINYKCTVYNCFNDCTDLFTSVQFIM